MDVNSLEQVLLLVLTPDSAVVKGAEEKVKEITRSAEGCGGLLEVLRVSKNPSVRQLSATLLRTHLPKRWDSIPAQQRLTAKGALVELLMREEDTAVRGSICSVTAAVAATDPWPELPSIGLQMLDSSQSESTRRMGFALLRMYLEAVGPINFPLPTLIPMVVSSIALDESLNVRINALHTYGALLFVFPDDQDLLNTLPRTIEASRNLFETARRSHVASEDELNSVACTIFEILTDVLTMWSPKIRELFPLMLNFALEEVLFNHQSNEPASVDEPRIVSATREAATEFVAKCITSCPKALRKAKMMERCIEAAFTLMCESGADADAAFNGELDEDETTALMLGVRLLDAAAMRLPPKDVFSLGMQTVQTLAGSTFTYQRAVGYRSMSILAEGCRSEFTRQSREMLSGLTNAFRNDSEPSVRASIMRAMGAIVESLEIDEMDEDVLAQVRDIAMSAAIQGIHDQESRVRKLSCATMEAALTLYEEEEDIAPYVGPITEALSKADILEEAVSAAAALAEVAGESFARSPSFGGVVQAILQLMEHEDEEHISSRAVATAAAASIITAMADVDAQKRDELVQMVCSRALAGMKIDSPELREHSFVLFSRVTDNLGVRVTSAFGHQVIKEAIESMSKDDGVFLNAEGEEISGDLMGEGALVDDDDDGPTTFSVRTALMEEKAAAAEAVGSIAGTMVADGFVVGNAEEMCKTMETVMDAVDQFRGYFHELIRAATVRLAAKVAVSTKAAFYGQRDELRKRALDSAMLSAIDFIRNDDDYEVVAAALDSICIVCEGLGPVHVEGYRGGITEAINSVLDGSAAISEIDVEDDEQPGYQEDVEARRDEIVDGLMEAVISMCKAFRGFYAEDFLRLLPLILAKFCKPINPPADFSAAIGGIAESLNYTHFGGQLPLPGNVDNSQLYLNTLASDSSAAQLMPIGLLGLREKDHPQLRRNSAFLIGVLFQRSSQNNVLWKDVANVVREVAFLLDPNIEQVDGSVVDNARGCLGRIVASPYFPEGQLNTTDLIRLLVGKLPFEDDPSETFSVARAVIGTASRGDKGWNDLLASAVGVIELLSRTILLCGDASRSVTDDMAELSKEELLQIREVFFELQRRCGNDAIASTSLSPEERQLLESLLRS